MAVKDFFDNLNGGARWDVGVSINRSNSLPLDANSVFASLEAAQNYAAGNPAEGTLANAYPGQVLAVVTDAKTVIYYIDANMTLQPIGDANDIMAYIGNIPEGSDAKTIIEYINAKTSGIATDAALTELQDAVAKKVDAVDGKGLSTNDLTDELKANYDDAYEHSQVAHAPADAQANVIEKIKVNGVEQTVTEKAVDIAVPTKVSELTNDSGYLTEHQDISGKADKATTLEGYGITDAYTADEVDEAVQGAKDFAQELVDALPEQTDYTVSIEEDTTDSTIAKRYIFKQLGEEIGRIDLAKELVVTAGAVKEVAEADVPYAGAVVGDKYIELVIANQETPIYVPAKDLVDIYTAASGAAEVQVAINGNNEISATLVDGGVTEAKLAEDVKVKLNKVYEEVGVAAGLVEALADGQVKANKEAIDGLNADALIVGRVVNDLGIVYTFNGNPDDYDYTGDVGNILVKVSDEAMDLNDLVLVEGFVDGVRGVETNFTIEDGVSLGSDIGWGHEVTVAIIANNAAAVVAVSEANAELERGTYVACYESNVSYVSRIVFKAPSIYDVENDIAALSAKVDTDNKKVSEYVADAISGKVDIEEGKSLVEDTLIAKLEAIEAEAQVNVIDTVDEAQFAIDADKKLTLLDVDQAKITGLTNAAGGAITLEAALEGKVDKNGTDRLITEAEAAKLELLVIDEETGQAAISGTVNANQVQGLADLLAEKVDKVEGMGLSANNLTDTLLAKLNGIEAGAQVNVIEGITFNGAAVSVGEDKIADITYALPIADADTLGGVKSSAVENKVTVEEDGTMSVNAINANKLVQTDGEYLIMNGGSAAI